MDKALNHATSLPDSALYYAKLALSYAEEEPDLRALANFTTGQVLAEQGLYAASVSYLHQSLTDYRGLKQPEMIVTVLNELATACANALLTELSYQHAQEALRLSQNLSSIAHRFDAHMAMGYCLERRHQTNEALAWYTKADSINRGTPDQARKVKVWEALASIYEDLEQYEKAREYYFLVNPYVHDHIFLYLANINNLGDTYRKTQNNEEALLYYHQGLDTAKQLGIKRGVEQNTRDIALTLSQMGLFQEAIPYYQQHYYLYNELHSEQSTKHLTQLQMLYDTEQHKRERDLQESKAQLRTLQRDTLFILSGACLAFLVYLFLIFRRTHKTNLILKKTKRKDLRTKRCPGITNLEINQQKELVEKQNAKLRESAMIIRLQHEQIAEKNNHLEKIVAQRTAELLKANKELKGYVEQLEMYGNLTAHNLRGPLARVLGLCSLFEIETQAENKGKIIYEIGKTASELDQVIHDMNHILELGASYTE
ncbi:MAG: tetratricopeptide repeat protein, partial [Cytophagales bacterium]|nr:tetratricopeptide repeat protein [Cytophagales bacterium]